MIYNVINENFYILKIPNTTLILDIYDHNEIKNLIKKVLKSIQKKYNIKGNLIFDIYIDNLYGMIIEINKINELFPTNLTDIKIKFNLNTSFLYETDYFYLYENNIKKQNIYYYNQKYYLEIINNIPQKDYLNLLENSEIIYNNQINTIIKKGIKQDKNINFLKKLANCL